MGATASCSQDQFDVIEFCDRLETTLRYSAHRFNGWQPSHHGVTDQFGQSLRLLAAASYPWCWCPLTRLATFRDFDFEITS
jgi:hypothetical protein